MEGEGNEQSDIKGYIPTCAIIKEFYGGKEREW